MLMTSSRRGPLLAAAGVAMVAVALSLVLDVRAASAETTGSSDTSDTTETTGPDAPTAADCVAGRYFDGSACVLADVGFFVATDGADAQVAIPLGRGGTGGGDDGRGSIGTAACEAGTFRGDPATTACRPAPAGSFVAEAGATSATPCPRGRFQDDTGSTVCRVIPLGSRGTGGSDGLGSTGVEQCEAGTFRGDQATTSCAEAPPGSFVEDAGAEEATVCPPGRFQPLAGRTSCDAAPAGSHVPIAGSAAAALCPPGTFSATTGATTCTPAAIGSYVPRPGSTEQLRCPSATEPGLAVCPVPTAAPTPEREVPDTGDEPLSPEGDPCPPGTWSTTGTSRAGSSCTPASPGTFVAASGATAEEPCPAGTFSDDFGATACTPAPVGTFVAGTGAMDPVPCPGATEPGMMVCPELAAPADSVVNAEPAARTSVWWWVGGLSLVLAAGGLGFVQLQRRTGMLDAAVAPASVAGPPPTAPVSPSGSVGGPAPAAAADVLEWDEALDGPLEDMDPPPSA